jgi:hypothetical protein
MVSSADIDSELVEQVPTSELVVHKKAVNAP